MMDSLRACKNLDQTMLTLQFSSIRLYELTRSVHEYLLRIRRNKVAQKKPMRTKVGGYVANKSHLSSSKVLTLLC